MERYGHDSPPKVMWGVDKQIREPFQKALAIAKSLPEVSISTVKEDFEAFATEFESMIFKEESIPLMILLESSTQVRLLRRVLPLAMPSSVRLINGFLNVRALLRKRVQRNLFSQTPQMDKSSRSSICQKVSLPLPLPLKRRKLCFAGPPQPTGFWQWLSLSRLGQSYPQSSPHGDYFCQ